MSQKAVLNKSKNLKVNETDSDKSSHIVTSDAPIDAQKSAVKVISANFPVCRICQTTTNSECLISPCHCKGTLAYIHQSCLERWLNQSGRNFCELCKFRYNAVETQRYGLCEGLYLWISHPRNLRHVRSDVIIGILLTFVTAGLLFVCLYGMGYFITEARKVGVKKGWIKFSLVSFLVIIVMGYMVSMYLLARDHFVPWYNWWTRTVNIRLVLSSARPEVAIVENRL